MEMLSRMCLLFSSKRFVLAVMLIFTYSVSRASSSCSNTVILNGEEDVTVKVCTQIYSSSQCMKFTNSFDLSSLPSDKMKGSSVQRPATLNVDPKMNSFREANQIEYYPGLDFHWMSPASQTSRMHVSGFYITLHSVDGTQRDCRMMAVDHSDYRGQLQFQYNLDKLSAGHAKNYSVKIYSLPLPDVQADVTSYMNNTENYKRLLVTTQDPYSTALDKVQSPAFWRSGVSVRPNLEHRSIDVWFTLPSPSLGFNFTKYMVHLVDVVKDINNPILNGGIKEVIVDPGLKEIRAHTTFTNVPLEGCYRVSVRAFDHHFGVKDQCECYIKKYEELIGDWLEDCEACQRSRSGVFDLNFDVTCQTPTPVPAAVEEEDDDDTNSTVLAGAVCGAVLFLICCAVGVFLYRTRCNRKKTNSLVHDPGNNFEGPAPSRLVSATPILKKKTVFLLFSSDHECHREMLRQFKIFLQTHCKCNVIDQSDFDDNQRIGITSWLVDKFSKCDLIILFDSPGAYQRVVAYNSNRRQEYYSVQTGQHRELFNLGLSHIYENIIARNLRDKALVVSLTEGSFQDRDLFLGALKKWVLPKDLPFFLQQIHNLKQDEVTSYKNQLPMMHTFEMGLLHMPELIVSIKDSMMYEKENPDWFSSHFVNIAQPIETIERADSYPDSSYGSMTGSRLRSITPPLEGSNNPSPISDDFVNPRFPKPWDQHEPDQLSCYTLLTEVYPEMKRNSSSSNGNEHQRLQEKENNGTPFPKTPNTVPPRQNSELDTVENLSTAIGYFNQKTSQQQLQQQQQQQQQQHRITSDGTVNKVIPPRSEITAENLSLAIGCFNHSESPRRNRSADEPEPRDTIKPPRDTIKPPRDTIKPPRDYGFDVENSSMADDNSNTPSSSSAPAVQSGIKPPLQLSDINVDSCSAALGMLNVNNKFGNNDDGTNGGDNSNTPSSVPAVQSAIKPPLQLSDINVDSCSAALGMLNVNNRFGNNDDGINGGAVGGACIDINGNGGCAGDDQHHQPMSGNVESISPPRDDLSLEEYSDSFSYYLSSRNSDFRKLEG